ncbi:MAG TPA: serine/threonine-protein kinase [Phycisphaerales bacterium]|nr:serine/threonine-protein kinase [Phycisphaerales bacterium]
MPSQTDTSWYLDETSLIAELKRGRFHAEPPSLPGYDELIELKRGGQGAVYVATQRSTGRKVAIKVLLEGAYASQAARRRFEREIELIASLRHPNIVHIYDSGVTPRESPGGERLYFVMEFIDGMSLGEYAAPDAPLRHNHSPQEAHRALIDLFAVICEAVSYAHQRGVIHRDLKPSNIRIDAEGRPHVLDFGLAKALHDDDATRSGVSVTGQFMGSLPWASPEQVQADAAQPLAVDTRSDVYSLGVILFHLLADRFPYDVGSGVRQTLENIITREPSRLRSIVPNMDEAIEAIAMQCLAKHPDDRYQSASELAKDVRRYLAGEPIEAKRDSTWSAMRRNLRRYRLTLALAAAVVALLTVGVAAFSWQAHAAQQARAAEAEQRELAERRFADVRALARRFMFDVHDAIEPLAGSRKARELLVTSALEYLERLSQEAGDDRDLLDELASAYDRVASIQGYPYSPNLGNTAGALQSYQTALAIRRQLVEAHPDDMALHGAMAGTMRLVGDLLQWTGDSAGALAHFAEAGGILTRVAAAMPDDRVTQRELAASHLKTGDVTSWQGRHAEAMPHFMTARSIIAELVRTDPDNVREAINLSVCNSNIGFVLQQTGDIAGALMYQREALELTERLLEKDPENSVVRRSVSINANQVGSVLQSKGQLDDALAHYRRALTLALELLDADPGSPLAVSDVTYTRNKIAGALAAMGDRPGALAEVHAARELREQLAANDPENAGFQRDLGVSRYMAAMSHIALAEDDQYSAAERQSHWREARFWSEQSRNIFLDMQQKGTLREVDTNNAAMLTEQIARCDAMIAELENP